MGGEPEAKKQKTENDDEPTGWEDHTLNVSEALMKADEGKHFQELVDAEVSTLQGIGPFSARVLESLGARTVADLAKYKYFLMARAIATLSETETKGGRLKGAVLNIDNAVDKEYETKTLTEICEAPTEALEGIGSQACELLETLGVKTVKELSEFKYCRWAEAIVQAAALEEMKTAKERKVDAALKKLG
jgi:predicted flap endonuclease-1-like 5' DNA nuclease